MFQVSHPEEPPPELLLQHVLNERQLLAVMLPFGVQAALVDNMLPFPGHLLRDDEAGGGPLGVTGVLPAPVNELPEDLLHGLLPPAPEGKLPVLVHSEVWLQSYFGLAVQSR